MDDKGSFVRWQSIQIAQLGYALNVILTLATASLGYAFASVVRPDLGLGKTRIPFAASLFLLFASITCGLACTVNRLCDFKKTKDIARQREQPSSDRAPKSELDHTLKSRRDEAMKLGSRTWTLFCWQVGLFFGGEFLLGLALTSLILGTASKKQEGPSLSETVAWIEQTYNPHEGGRGHGHVSSYRQSPDPRGKPTYTESAETISAKGCAFTLRIDDDTSASTSGKTQWVSTFSFNLTDVDSKSITVTASDSRLGTSCSDAEVGKSGGSSCDQANIDFSIQNDAPLVEVENRGVRPQLPDDQLDVVQHPTLGRLAFPKTMPYDKRNELISAMERNKAETGSPLLSRQKLHVAFFHVDDPEYSQRMAKAFRHAVELCGGKPSTF